MNRETAICDWNGTVSLDDYKVVLYRSKPQGGVAEVAAIPGCHALMPTRDNALAELAVVFQLISEEYLQRGESLPAAKTWCASRTCFDALSC